MRIFDSFNQSSNEPCPICKTKADKPVVLVIKSETIKGHTAQGIQVHVECLELSYSERYSTNMIFQIIEKEEQ